MTPVATKTPISIKLIPEGSFKNFILMKEKNAASVMRIEKIKNNSMDMFLRVTKILNVRVNECFIFSDSH